ncbi:hypothetical protein BC832DRAFT_549091 [Gaertneriomyces semiglobifer]|nr:hypothetical protein BC832DRAFT_549091 [Gaertneriomyces semiglobifer]
MKLWYRLSNPRHSLMRRWSKYREKDAKEGNGTSVKRILKKFLKIGRKHKQRSNVVNAESSPAGGDRVSRVLLVEGDGIVVAVVEDEDGVSSDVKLIVPPTLPSPPYTDDATSPTITEDSSSSAMSIESATGSELSPSSLPSLRKQPSNRWSAMCIDTGSAFIPETDGDDARSTAPSVSSMSLRHSIYRRHQSIFTVYSNFQVWDEEEELPTNSTNQWNRSEEDDSSGIGDVATKLRLDRKSIVGVRKLELLLQDILGGDWGVEEAIDEKSADADDSPDETVLVIDDQADSASTEEADSVKETAHDKDIVTDGLGDKSDHRAEDSLDAEVDTLQK